MVKKNYRLVFLLVAVLTMFFFQNGHTESLVEIPPSLPTISPEEQNSVFKKFKENYKILDEFLGANKDFLPEFPAFQGDELENYYEMEKKKYSSFSSRAGSTSNIKQDFVIQNLVATARSIHGSNYIFKEKEFYKSNFSVAANIDAINARLTEIYGSNNFPKIYKGVVILLEVVDPQTGDLIYSGWGKINTDTQRDFIDNSYNYPFSKNKVCLAVDSENKIPDFQGKEARIIVFISHPPSNEFLQQEMENQGVIVRPKESIYF